jgi:hypothetical protein
MKSVISFDLLWFTFLVSGKDEFLWLRDHLYLVQVNKDYPLFHFDLMSIVF